MSATLRGLCGPTGLATPATRRCRNVRAAAVGEVLEKASKGPNPEVPAGLNKFSSRITQPKSQGASQAMLYATGLNENDLNKPQVRSSSCTPYYSHMMLSYASF